MPRPCRVCQTPETATRVLFELLAGKGQARAALAVGLSCERISLHVRHCLPKETAHQLRRASHRGPTGTATLPRDIPKRTAIRCSPPHIEAESLYIAALGPGQSLESIRTGILLTRNEEKWIRILDGPDTALAVAQFREDVLAAFDEIADHPAQKCIADIERRRHAALASARQAAARVRVHARQREQKPTRANDWDI